MSWLEAIVLGLIQGLTEFLPVSSSGHLEIAKSLFGVDPESSFYFTVAVHGATVLSTLAVFYSEIITLIRGSFKFTMNEETGYILKILISMIPVGLAGFLFKDEVEALFSGNMNFIGAMLLVTAGLLLTGHLVRNRGRAIGYTDAFIIGLAQAIAVIPGISRSGATISAGLMLGNRKEELARFSFLMVLVPVVGANLVEILSGNVTSDTIGAGVVIAGFISAFVSGYLACRWMISLVKRSRMIWFAIYCAVAGLLTILIG